MTSSIPVVEPSDPVQSALDHLKENLGFRCGNLLGKGTYGSVVRVTSSELVPLAAKIVQRRMLNELEVNIWPKLQHHNILKLVHVICELEGVVIFLTDLMATNLFLRLQNREFRDDPRAIDRCRIYARQVFSGLSYLHRLKLCHLDLRAENVFLAEEDDRAVVADFSGLSWSEIGRKFCPLPHSLRPPEMLTAKKKYLPMPIDLWACGLLIANMFLGKGYYVCTVKNSRAGHIEAVHQYTGLFQCEVYIMKFVKETYSSCSFSSDSVKHFISIVHRFLQMDPSKRLRVDEALSHTFINFSSGKVNENKTNDKINTELPLTVQYNDPIIMETVRSSEKFKVTFCGLSPGNVGSAAVKNSFEIKSTKTSKWSKYKRWWTDVARPSFRSAPFFKAIKFKRHDKKKLRKTKS